MRNLVFILLALNLLYFLWPREAQPSRGDLTRGKSNLAMLYTLDEIDQRPAAASSVPQAMPVSVSDTAMADRDLPDLMPQPFGARSEVVAVEDTSQEATLAALNTSVPTVAEASISNTAIPQAATAERAPANATETVESAQTTDTAPIDVATVSDLMPAPFEPPLQALAAAQCFTLGPFKDKSALTDGLGILSQLGVETASRTSTERRTRGYWVYLPPSKSREDALKKAEDLAGKGFTDYFVVAGGEQDNSISLGLFTLKSGSERRVEQVKALGYSPKVEVRYTEISVYWIDLESQKNVDWPAFMREQFPKGQIERIKRACS